MAAYNRDTSDLSLRPSGLAISVDRTPTMLQMDWRLWQSVNDPDTHDVMLQPVSNAHDRQGCYADVVGWRGAPPVVC